MRYKIFNEEPAHDRVCYFKLEYEDDIISLVVCNEDGRVLSTLIDIKPDGSFYTIGDVDPSLGLYLDKTGGIVVN